MSDLALISTVLSVTVAVTTLISFVITRKQNTKKDGIEMGHMQTDIQYIKARVDDVYIIQKETDKKIDGLERRVTALEVEQSANKRRLEKLERKQK